MKMPASYYVNKERRDKKNAGRIISTIFVFLLLGVAIFGLYFGWIFYDEAGKGEASTDAELELKTWKRIIGNE